MTPWLRPPSAFRTLRAAVLPPVLTTTAFCGVYGISAHGSASEQEFRPTAGIRPASYVVRSDHDDRLWSGLRITSAARRSYVTRLAYRARPEIAPLLTPPIVPEHVPSAAPAMSDTSAASDTAASDSSALSGRTSGSGRTATAEPTASGPPTEASASPASVIGASTSPAPPTGASTSSAPPTGTSPTTASQTGTSAREDTASASPAGDRPDPGHTASAIPTHTSTPTHASVPAHVPSAPPTRTAAPTRDEQGDGARAQDKPRDHGAPPDHDKPRGHARHHGHAHPPATGRTAADPPLAWPSPDSSRAGSWAGEGRIRPGRPDSEPDDEDEPTYTDQDPSTPPQRTPAPADSGTETPGTGIDPSADAANPLAASPTPSHGAAGSAREASASQPVVEILPLGSGLVLVGLGLALALLALRLRRE